MKFVDLFAGVGGFTQAAVSAGHRVVWAANHEQVAVDWHKINHPTVLHACQDLQQADFTKLPKHKGMLASPACQGHTPARGTDKPHHDGLRATAWSVVTCAECHNHDLIVVENVVGFRTWKLYPVWKDAFLRMGYRVTEYVLDAADFGVPQHRVRLFILMTKEKVDFNWTPVDHQPASSFLNLEEGKWNKIDVPGRSQKTLDRIAAGRRQHGDVFLAPYYSRGSGLGGRSIHRPIGTLTTKGRWAVVRGDEMRMLTVSEQRKAMGFPDSYQLPDSATQATHFLGNAVCPPVPEAILRAAA